MAHKIYEHDAGRRLIKAVQVKLAMLIHNTKDADRNDIYLMTRVFYLHQTVPIFSTFLLKTMLRNISENKYNQYRMLESYVSKFPNWNLSYLDLEKIDDEDCIEAIYDTIF